MRQRSSILCLFIAIDLLVGGNLHAQKLPIQNTDSVRYSKMTGDDKSNFWGTLGIIGSYASQSGSAFSFQPTLYNLLTLFGTKFEEAPNFRKERFLRNAQLNLSVTPSQSSALSFDTTSLGFTYAYKNNKNITRDEYNSLSLSPAFDIRNTIVNSLTVCQSNPDDVSSAIPIHYLLEKSTITVHDLDNIQSAVVYTVAAALNIPNANDQPIDSLKSSIVKAYNAPQTIFAQRLAALPKRSLMTGSFNSIYDFIHGQWQEFDFSPFSWNFYIAQKKQQAKGRMAECPAINVSLTYVVSDDTAKKVFNLDREIYKASAGINFVISKGNQDQPFLEIKPGADYQYIQSGKYQKETYTTVKPSVTLRIDISNSFSIPLTIKYDTTHPKNNLFGFLSIQYSASKKGS